MRVSKPSWLCLLLGLGTIIMACGGGEPSVPASALGSAHVVGVVQSAARVEDIAVVRVSVGAPDLSLVEAVLARTEGTWSGTVPIPAGTGRYFIARAFGASGELLFQGEATGVTITAGQTASVMLTLQEVNPPPPFENDAPRVTSLIVSTSTVAPGGTVTLEATARDPNPADTLVYAWSAEGGTFSAPGSATTGWTAPATMGAVTLTLRVTDPHGAEASLDVTLTVDTTTGDAVIHAAFNVWPQVTRVTASVTSVEVGQPTVATAVAADADGDALSYQWTAGCPGSWVDDTQPHARFTPSELPPASGDCNRCPLTVTVRDGRGGTGTGTLGVCVGPREEVRFRPEIVSTVPIVRTVPASPRMTFRVTARDAQDSPLTFRWTAAGTFESPMNGATMSEVAWRPPECVAPDSHAEVTATVTNGLGLATSVSFSVTGLPSCGVAAWARTAPMSIGRNHHTATLLPSGQVLVAGGAMGSLSADYLSSAELYDPATERWAPTGSMGSGRRSHTATVLPSGRVLVTGGRLNPSGASLTTAELYDPATGTWTPTGSMSTGRWEHSAVLLPSGSVLVVGGVTGSGVGVRTTRTELYDPATGTWTTTGSLTTGRLYHTATLLPAGQVLVVGGVDTTGSLGSAELYNPVMGGWRPTANLHVDRRGHTAVLLPSGQVLVASGWGDSGLTSTAELYNPVSGTWSVTRRSTLMPRSRAVAALLPSGRVLVAGGNIANSGSNGHTASAELYDPVTETWTATVSMPEPRDWAQAVQLPSGRVLVPGGSGVAPLSTVDLYSE